jgi:hypothetical protein
MDVKKVCLSIIIVLIIILPELYYEKYFRIGIPRIKINENPHLRDGDLILFRFETPVLSYNNGKRSSSFYFGKMIHNSTFYWFHGNPYSHCGIVVDGKIFHITADPFFNHLTGEFTIKKPVLSSLEDLYFYGGTMYLYRYPWKTKPLKSYPDVQLLSDVFDTVVEHGLNTTIDDKYYSCARFVDHLQYNMGIRNKKNKYANLCSVLEGYIGPTLIETPWTISHGF